MFLIFFFLVKGSNTKNIIIGVTVSVGFLIIVATIGFLYCYHKKRKAKSFQNDNSNDANQNNANAISTGDSNTMAILSDQRNYQDMSSPGVYGKTPQNHYLYHDRNSIYDPMQLQQLQLLHQQQLMNQQALINQQQQFMNKPISQPQMIMNPQYSANIQDIQGLNTQSTYSYQSSTTAVSNTDNKESITQHQDQPNSPHYPYGSGSQSQPTTPTTPTFSPTTIPTFPLSYTPPPNPHTPTTPNLHSSTTPNPHLVPSPKFTHASITTPNLVYTPTNPDPNVTYTPRNRHSSLVTYNYATTLPAQNHTSLSDIPEVIQDPSGNTSASSEFLPAAIPSRVVPQDSSLIPTAHRFSIMTQGSSLIPQGSSLILQDSSVIHGLPTQGTPIITHQDSPQSTPIITHQGSFSQDSSVIPQVTQITQDSTNSSTILSTQQYNDPNPHNKNLEPLGSQTEKDEQIIQQTLAHLWSLTNDETLRERILKAKAENTKDAYWKLHTDLTHPGIYLNKLLDYFHRDYDNATYYTYTLGAILRGECLKEKENEK